jgi:hypothetical protein
MIKWNPSEDFLAQSGHFLSGMCSVFGPAAVCHGSKSSTFYALLGTILFFSFMLIKEVFVDPKMEGEPFFWCGVEDMFFSASGLTVAWILMRIF